MKTQRVHGNFLTEIAYPLRADEMKKQISNTLHIFLVSIICFFLFSSCKIPKPPINFLGFFPILDISKQITLENHIGRFTNEYGREASFTIQLTQPPFYDVKIGPIKSLDVTEGIVVSDTYLTFNSNNYNTPQTVTVRGVEDGISDGNQEYRISFGSVVTQDYSYCLLNVPDVILVNTDKETAGIASSPRLGLSTNEVGTTAEINVVLSTQPGADVVIPGFISDNTSECTVSGSITFTTENWDQPQKVIVTGVDDLSVDGAKNCYISSQNSSSEDKVYENKTMTVITVVNVDNDIPGFTYIPLTSAETTEAGGQAQFGMVMNTKPYGNISITGISSSDSSEGSVNPANISFTTNDWNVSKIITLTGQDDFMEDGNINYTVVFPNSSIVDPLDTAYDNFTLSSAGSFTNIDNDTRGVDVVPLAPSTSLSPLVTTEGGGAGTFQVRLTSVPCDSPSTPENCSPTSVTINLTNNDTTQYSISPASLTFSPANYNTYQTVTVTAVDDKIDDDDSYHTLVLESIVSTSDYGGLNPNDVSIQVVDNDTAGFTVSPSGGVTVNENDPGATGLEASFTVVLNSEPTSTVTIGSITSSDTLEVTVAPTTGGGNTPITNRTLVFTPTENQAVINSDSNGDSLNDTSTGGWNVPQTVRVRAVVDGTLDGTKDRLIRFGSRTTTDTKYSNSTTTPLNDLPATNIDSGTPFIVLQSISSTSFNEDGTSTITFQIVLATLPLSNVTISNITSSDTTEGVILPNGGGSPITNRTLIFTTSTNQSVTGTNTTTGGWNVPQTITVQSVTDDFADGNISFKVNIPAATGGADYNGKFPTSSNAAYSNGTGELTLTNLDNDTRGITVSKASISVTEGGAPDTFTVKLNSDPCTTPSTPSSCSSGSVTLNLTNNNTTQYSVSPTSLTFNTGTWNSAQTVTITPLDDNFDESDITYSLVFDAITGTTDYGGLDPADLPITVVDNDTAAINLTLQTNYSDVTSSNGGFTEYKLNLGSRPAPGNSVTVTASVPTAAPQEGSILAADNTTQLNSRSFVFTDSDWNTVQTFRVRGLTGSGTGSATFVLTLSASEGPTVPPTGYTALTYNSYNSITKTQTITNYHIGTGKKIRLAGSTSTLAESSNTTGLFYVLLNQAPVADVTVNLGIDSSFPCTLPASVGSTKQFSLDKTSITLTSANWSELTTNTQVKVSKVDDAVDDGDVICNLRVTSVSSTDPYYSGLGSTDYEEPLIKVSDNDIRGVTFQNSSPVLSSNLTVSRSGAIGTVDLVLDSQPTSDVTLSFSDTGTLLNYSPGTLTFTPANYSTPQTLSISGNSSGSASDVSVTVQVSASSGESSTGASNSGIYNGWTGNITVNRVGEIYDLVPCTGAGAGTCSAANATGGVVTGTYNTSESGGKSYFGIRLRAKPSSNVTIPISSSNTAEGIVSTPNLTFTPTDFNTFQVVTITGVDDFSIDGNIAYSIVFGAMAGDGNFSVTIPSLTVTNLDNDTASVVLSVTSETSIGESSLGRSFTVKLNSQPTADVSIPLSVNTPTAPDTGLTITSGATLIFTSANWNVPQTVTFTWAYDGTALPTTRDHSILLGTITSTDPDYSGMNPPDYSISITNTPL